jgi:hypothetical protein
MKLYGAARCHKTQDYRMFFDVEKNGDYAEELRGLYENRKLNFQTITIGKKKLRNSTDKDLNKWFVKPSQIKQSS